MKTGVSAAAAPAYV